MRIFVLVLIAATVLLASCGGDKGENKTQSPKFMPTPVPVQAQAAGWQGVTVNTLCLTQSIRYGEANQWSEGWDGLKKEIGIIFSRMGLKVVDVSQPCDAALTINVTSTALGEQYEAGFYCYEGTTTSADFTLSAPERETVTAHFSETIEPADSVQSNNCHSVEDARYRDTMLPVLLDGLHRLYGPVIYGWIVVEEGEGWCGQGQGSACGQFYNSVMERLDGPRAMAAVPPLIVALDSKVEYIRTASAAKLQAITGQTLGNDKQEWENWWASTGSAIPTLASGSMSVGAPTPTVDMNTIINQTATALAAPGSSQNSGAIIPIDTPTKAPSQ